MGQLDFQVLAWPGFLTAAGGGGAGSGLVGLDAHMCPRGSGEPKSGKRRRGGASETSNDTFGVTISSLGNEF